MVNFFRLFIALFLLPSTILYSLPVNLNSLADWISQKKMLEEPFKGIPSNEKDAYGVTLIEVNPIDPSSKNITHGKIYLTHLHPLSRFLQMAIPQIFQDWFWIGGFFISEEDKKYRLPRYTLAMAFDFSKNVIIESYTDEKTLFALERVIIRVDHINRETCTIRGFHSICGAYHPLEETDPKSSTETIFTPSSIKRSIKPGALRNRDKNHMDSCNTFLLF